MDFAIENIGLFIIRTTIVYFWKFQITVNGRRKISANVLERGLTEMLHISQLQKIAHTSSQILLFANNDESRQHRDEARLINTAACTFANGGNENTNVCRCDRTMRDDDARRDRFRNVFPVTLFPCNRRLAENRISDYRK